ncbi:MAG: hypothetical protein PHR53_07240 [Bacteroidales bacterium]|nr:hypothetical protein [Bacteroidales bacterium]
MDNNLKESFDHLLTEVNNIQDLTGKLELLNYILHQADYSIWTIEEERRQYENLNSY